ncbi:MAG: ABC transporter ATP-binding protein/permease [Lachnospiraceae bacterium]|nr:ABC transporter ATP-binding protein/permease [Lachnospiraceae bacterium]
MIQTLAKHVKEYKRAALITPVCMIVEVIAEMVVPKLMAVLIDSGIEAENMKVVTLVGIRMLLVAAVGLIAGLLGAKYASEASCGLARNLRKAMFQNIQTFSFSNIDHFRTAGLVTRLTTDVSNVQNAFQMILRMFVRAPFSIIIAMVMAFSINKKIAGVYLIAVAVLAIGVVLIMSNASKYFKQVFPKYDELNESVQENVTAQRVVKSFVREDYEINKFRLASHNIYDMFVRAEKSVNFALPLMQCTVYGCILLISWLGAKMIVVGNLTTGELASLLSYCMNILTSIMMLSFMFVMLTMSQAAGNRICEVLDEKADIVDPENPVTEVKNGEIEFKNVMFRYNPASPDAVLNDINLKIPSGEMVGILGTTGSSKTSLISLISRLYDANDGEVKVGGVNVKDYSLRTLRDSVSVVLQKNVLFSGSIRDNLKWGDAEASDEDIKRVCNIACCDEFIEKMPEKYDSRIEQGGTNLSGGQKQRICIARALLKKPKILILDDSTSAVDTATDASITKKMAEFMPETTRIIIAQRIQSIKNADRIIVMDKGYIVGMGTHEELVKSNDIYREVFEAQQDGNRDFDKTGGEA